MSKRRFLTVFIIVGCHLGLGLSQQLPELVADQGYADTILVNGKIVTMDDRSSVPDTPGNIFQAMAIKGDTIMALGSDEEVRKLANSGTRVIDVGRRTVIPGLIGTHYHIFTRAADKYGPSQGLVDPSVRLTVVTEQTAEATAKKIRDTVVNAIRVRRIPEGQWITVSLQENKENRRATMNTWVYTGVLNKRQIDAATSDHPLFIRVGSVQSLLNSVAVEEFKKVFPDWEESTDLENRMGAGRDGQGAVPENQGLAFELWWGDKSVESFAETMRLKGLDLQELGITTIATRILFPKVIAAYHLLNREGKMPHRMAYYIESQRGNFMSLKSTREFYKGAGAPWTTHAAGNKMLWLNGMSQEVWDSTQNEVCLGPDVQAPREIQRRERCPEPGTRPWEAVKTAVVHGWRPVQVHATSSHGARLYIQMLEEAMKEGNFSVEYMRNLRTTLEHNILLGNPADVMAGIKKYGIILNVMPAFLDDVPENIKDYGEQLRAFAMPVKTWINEGIRVTFEADATDFWSPIYSLVTRRIRLGQENYAGWKREEETDVVLLPDQAIDRVTALKMVTTWGSEYMLAEDTIGTLEPGKYADFAVLDKDFFTIPVEEIRDGIPVVMTGLGGEIVHDNLQ
jgi:predicted amidohydrolase YtcJ